MSWQTVLAQHFLLSSCFQSISLGRGPHVQRLMRAQVVIEADLIPDDMTGVLQGLESVTMDALVFEGSDDPLDHAVLFEAVGRDELLAQAIALNQGRVAAACEDQAVVGVEAGTAFGHGRDGRIERLKPYPELIRPSWISHCG